MSLVDTHTKNTLRYMYTFAGTSSTGIGSSSQHTCIICYHFGKSRVNNFFFNLHREKEKTGPRNIVLEKKFGRHYSRLMNEQQPQGSPNMSNKRWLFVSYGPETSILCAVCSS